MYGPGASPLVATRRSSCSATLVLVSSASGDQGLAQRRCRTCRTRALPGVQAAHTVADAGCGTAPTAHVPRSKERASIKKRTAARLRTLPCTLGRLRARGTNVPSHQGRRARAVRRPPRGARPAPAARAGPRGARTHPNCPISPRPSISWIQIIATSHTRAPLIVRSARGVL